MTAFRERGYSGFSACAGILRTATECCNGTVQVCTSQNPAIFIFGLFILPPAVSRLYQPSEQSVAIWDN